MELINSTHSIMNLFQNKELVTICAPMVRYSKLQFRSLVREYNCDLCFTPMILADSFCQSQKARANEFTTNEVDRPLIVQFAANTVHDFVGAAHMISAYADGADLNCGCPQRWAKCQGLGCVMLENPDLIYDLVRQCRNQIDKPFTVSVKMRLLSDLKKSVAICQQLERCGVDFMTVHGRTPLQHTGEVNLEALRVVKDSVACPVVANGGAKNLEDVNHIQRKTKCKGVMVANGILTNPELFSGSDVSVSCVQSWVDICFNSTLDAADYLKYSKLDPSQYAIPEKPKNLTFQCFHHHLVFMLEKILPKTARRIFNNLNTFEAVLRFLEDYFNVRPALFASDKFKRCSLSPIVYTDLNRKYLELCEINSKNINDVHSNMSYDPEHTDGRFFDDFCESDFEEENVSCLFTEND